MHEALHTTPPQTRRLHISPFNPALVPVVLPPPVLQNATSISYHSIQTFPERSYGYITLPTMDAEKITKKLHGSILKGSKMKVAEARPEKPKRRLEETEEEEELGRTERKKARNSRSKDEDGLLLGVELPKERKVKRGWTEVEEREKKDKKAKKEKKAKTKSAYTNEPELLFKTKVPPNAALVADGSSRKEKGKKHRKGKADREVVVHEFANTTKQPAFIRDSTVTGEANGTTEYIDGKGWVDWTGEVVDAEPKSVKKPHADRSKDAEKVKVPTPAIALSKPEPPPEDDETSSSGSSSSSSSTSSTSPRLDRLSITRSSATPPPVPRLTTSIPPPVHQPQPHPLETLFKRPPPPTSTPSSSSKKPNLEVSTSFSFFNDDDPGAMTGHLAPRTPATQIDIRNRRQRSAAPTPDTAMPGKSFWGNRRSESLEAGDVSDGGLPTLGEQETMGIGRDEDGGNVTRNGTGEGKDDKTEESAFAKEFWEKRGERNRAVKRRVREAKKEQRQKENKRRG